MFSYVSRLLFPTSDEAIRIPSVTIHEIETAVEKPGRSLKHLLKLNHANFAILHNNMQFHNHAPHLLISSYLLGGDSNDLNRCYDTESKLLDPWAEAPGEVTGDDWRDFLGKREYQRAFVDLFEDELVREGYDWKVVLHKFLFTGKEPLINSIIADLGHPLIHLGYALEISSRDVAMEALGLVATCYNDIHKYFDDPSYSQAEPLYHSSSPLEILEKVRNDRRFSGLFTTPGDHNLETLFREREAALLEHWNAWTLSDPVAQFRDSQFTAAALLVATYSEAETEAEAEAHSASYDGDRQHDFFLVHLLTTSHAIRIILPLIPEKFHIPLVRQWWLITVAIYIAQLRPVIDLDRVKGYDLQGRDWHWATKQAVKGEYSTDAHYVKAIRALKEAANTWGDAAPDRFYEKAAVKFAREFGGWGGFGLAS